MIRLLLGQLPGIFAGIMLTTAALIVFNAIWENPAVRADERDKIEAKARGRALALIEKRGEDNAEISDMDLATLCAELGGRWVPNESRCD